LRTSAWFKPSSDFASWKHLSIRQREKATRTSALSGALAGALLRKYFTSPVRTLRATRSLWGVTNRIH
jgi:hypothetical protein